MSAATIDTSKVGDIIRKCGADRSELINILHDIQEEYNWLPAEALKMVAKELGMGDIEVLGVASFYRSFSLKPRGRHIVDVCLGTACHVRGAPRILEEIERQLAVKSGETTKDSNFTLETVNCVGACALGPIIIIDKEYHGQMKADKTGRLIKRMKKQTAKTN
ncbi:MAG: NAD(P)H-dependent oxidoreductase subunit E [Pseudomonadota bacterium]